MTRTTTQIQLAKKLIHLIASAGVEDFILCAGARNAPLVKVLSRAKGIRVHPFFDERSAAFFALGRIQSDQRPVAVVTTSGTAVAELLPATIEAWYSGWPLILVTADRPPLYRGSGAPQSIEQVGIFSHYVGQSWDVFLDQKNQWNLDGIRFSSPLTEPVHINVCFDEPLLDEEVEQESCLFSPTKENQFVHPSMDFGQWKERVAYFFSQIKKPLIVVGKLLPQEQKIVEESLLHWPLPIYVECLSGLRESRRLCHLRIESGEGVFSSPRFLENFDSVIRIGGVPTTRLWRDLEKKLSAWPVLSFSSQKFSGLAVKKEQPLPLQSFTKINPFADFLGEKFYSLSQEMIQFSQDFLRWDRERASSLKSLLTQNCHSEPSIFFALSRLIPPGSLVFLGNSLPIREWDLAAQWEDRQLCVLSNRGANGIDGLFSTFLGASSSERENWAIVGDLSALYDLNSPWALSFARGQVWRFVIINNQGGKIFHRMFNDPLFENQHRLNFSGFADLWKMDYCRWRRVPDVLPELSSSAVIEIKPDLAATDAFWHQYSLLDGVKNCC